MDTNGLQERYSAAVERVTQSLKSDKTVLAAFLYGSANEGSAWVYSDIDIHVVVSDDKVGWREITLVQDGFAVNIDMASKGAYIRDIENRQGKSFLTASIFAGSSLLFSKDPILSELHEDIKRLGKREIKGVLMLIAAGCILHIEKAHKLVCLTKELGRALPYIINIAEGFASLVFFSNNIRAKKLNIPKATEHEPELFKTIYHNLLCGGLDERKYKNAIDGIFAFFRKNQEAYFSPLIEFISFENRVFTVTEINKHFSFGIHGTSYICEWLVRENLLNKTSSPYRLTYRSNVTLNEAAYFV